MVSVALPIKPPALADTFALPEVVAVVVTVKVVVLDPAGTVTLVATETSESANSSTGIPPAGASPLSVTVAVDVLPPVTVDGLKDTRLTNGGVMITDAVVVTPSRVAVNVTGVFALTGRVVTVNVAVRRPASTVTLAGVPA